ncbi:MAG: hypothetical protein KGK03_10300 [Candidatus Omnitrophica bacterium]|nr:hypothetical protein [Candidatus Omnitrophota bacterium]MDE2223444.1 hypothetical protein [Candidatus Omnitrophota bacterium]
MGLGPAAIKLNLELWARGQFRGTHSVMDMGLQELQICPADFQQLLQAARLPVYEKEKLLALQEGPKGICPSRSFYEALGIKDYACIAPGRGQGTIQFDLNCPLEDKSLYGRYDLVTDYGNNECVFNTCEAFRTIHRLCSVGGVLVMSQNAYRGKGLYAYDPSFLEGMASANNYKILFSSFVITMHNPTEAGHSCQYHVPLSWGLMDTFDWTRIEGLEVCYVMQKQSASDFCVSYQGVFFSNNQTHHGYRLNYSQNPPARAYVPVHTLDMIPDGEMLLDLRRRLYSKFKR